MVMKRSLVWLGEDHCPLFGLCKVSQGFLKLLVQWIVKSVNWYSDFVVWLSVFVVAEVVSGKQGLTHQSSCVQRRLLRGFSCQYSSSVCGLVSSRKYEGSIRSRRQILYSVDEQFSPELTSRWLRNVDGTRHQQFENFSFF